MLDYDVEVYYNGTFIAQLDNYDESNLVEHITAFGRSVYPFVDVRYTVNNQDVHKQYGGFVNLDGIVKRMVSQYEGDLLTSIMRQIDLTITDEDFTSAADLEPLRGIPFQDVQLWILSPECYEYEIGGTPTLCDLLFTVKFPKMWIYSAEWEEATKSFNLVCYDAMVLRMTPYERTHIAEFEGDGVTDSWYLSGNYSNYSLSVKVDGQKLAEGEYSVLSTRIDFSVAPADGAKIVIDFATLAAKSFSDFAINTVRYAGLNVNSLVNATQKIFKPADDHYEANGSSRRDVIDDICKYAACNVICSNLPNKQIWAKYPTATGLEIETSILKTVNLLGTAPICDRLIITNGVDDSVIYTGGGSDNVLEIQDCALYYNANWRSADDVFSKLTEETSGDYTYGYDLLEIEIPSVGLFEYGDVVTVYDLNGTAHKLLITSDYMEVAESITEKLASKTIFGQSVNDSNVLSTPKATNDESRRLTAVENKLIDSGWYEVDYEAGTGYEFGGYSTQTVKYRKIGNVVQIRGAFTVVDGTVAASNDPVTAFVLPDGFRPSNECYYICQGSGTYVWLCTVKSNGNVCVSRYRNSTTNEAIPATTPPKWLTVSVTFFTD